MATPYLSEIKVFSMNFAPKGWALCNGQLLPINQNQALFSLLGTTYGGDGEVNFALPNLVGRVPMHMGRGYTLGELGGEVAHTITLSELPQHGHPPSASTAVGNSTMVSANVWATAGANPYAASPNGAMAAGAVGNAGSSQPHENRQPFLALTFCIALQGIFPSQS